MASTAADRAKRGARPSETDAASALHEAMFNDGTSTHVLTPVEDATAPTPSAIKPVRVTTDLPRARYRALKRVCDEYADALGVADVPGQVVREQLVALLLTDRRTYLEIRRKVAAELNVPAPADD